MKIIAAGIMNDAAQETKRENIRVERKQEWLTMKNISTTC